VKLEKVKTTDQTDNTGDIIWFVQETGDTLEHRCRKFFTFWERDETFRKFLPKVQLSGVSRSKKMLNIPESILNMYKFLTDFNFIFQFFFINLQIYPLFKKYFKIFLNISSSSKYFWEHCSRVPPLFAPMPLRKKKSRG
jgi:hypothetical protein